MQKVHGPPIEPAFKSRPGYLAQPVIGPLAVSLALLLVLSVLIYFGFFGAS